MRHSHNEAIRQVWERRRLPEPAERRTLRKAAGLSAHTLGVTLGVTPTTVLRWEQGTSQPRGRNLTAYLQALDELRQATRGLPPGQGGEGRGDA
jgi:DNA-binding transcriptional regulator YiaG